MNDVAKELLLSDKDQENDEIHQTELKAIAQDFADDINQTESSNQALQYDLPDGKKYHLFISSSSKDSDVVNTLVLELEKVYGIRCVLGDRDFIGGKYIQQNINDTLQESMKILVCLTPDYLDSAWCEYEHNIAFVMSKIERRHCVIPLMLKPCEDKIPLSLQLRTYIDAGKETDVLSKIMEAFFCNPSSEGWWVPNQIPHDNILHPHNSYWDLEKKKRLTGMTVVSIKAVKNATLGNVWKFKPLTDGDKLQLKEAEVKLAIPVYKKLLPVINNSSFMQHYGALYHWPQILLLHFLSIVFAVSIVMYGRFTFEISTKTSSAGLYVGECIGASFSLAFILFVTIEVVRRLIRGKKLKMLNESMWTIQQKYYKKSKSYVLYDDDDITLPCLTIIRYDVNPCKNYIKNLLKICSPRKNDRVLESDADRYIDYFTKRNRPFLLHWSLLQTNFEEDRHYTYLHKRCLCQILEGSIPLPKESEEVEV